MGEVDRRTSLPVQKAQAARTRDSSRVVVVVSSVIVRVIGEGEGTVVFLFDGVREAGEGVVFFDGVGGDGEDD